jgi:hypothetical protein
METFIHREDMENFIHRENMAIFKRRLAEAKDATTRGILQQLLAAEQAKDVTPKSEK